MSYLSDILEVLSGPLFSTAANLPTEASFTLGDLDRVMNLLPKTGVPTLQIVPDTAKRNASGKSGLRTPPTFAASIAVFRKITP